MRSLAAFLPRVDVFLLSQSDYRIRKMPMKRIQPDKMSPDNLKDYTVLHGEISPLLCPTIRSFIYRDITTVKIQPD